MEDLHDLCAAGPPGHEAQRQGADGEALARTLLCEVIAAVAEPFVCH
jgi:hypothetical protein